MTDQPEVLERLEETLLGGARAYTRREVAERAGVPLERAERLWRSLGFAGVADDEVVFGDSDVDALATIAELVRKGVVSPDSETAVARSLGQGMARIADWQSTVLGEFATTEDLLPSNTDEAVRVAADLVPLIERLQSYVWRRHLVAAAGRIFPVAADDPRSDTMVVGFADIVGFTTLSRSISEDDLARLVERFESTTAGVIAEHNGRVVKTIGDEVLFVVQRPADAADIALALGSWVEDEEDMPKLRIGMAHGRVVSWLGDVYGPIVNVASRLTSVARPGSTVVDRELAAVLKDEPDYDLRRIRRVSVRGYSHLEPWVLRSRA
jgi:adenylate cyclase